VDNLYGEVIAPKANSNPLRSVHSSPLYNCFAMVKRSSREEGGAIVPPPTLGFRAILHQRFTSNLYIWGKNVKHDPKIFQPCKTYLANMPKVVKYEEIEAFLQKLSSKQGHRGHLWSPENFFDHKTKALLLYWQLDSIHYL